MHNITKTLLLLIVLVSSTLTTLAMKSHQPTITTIGVNPNDTYPVVARTEKSFGENYAISVKVIVSGQGAFKTITDVVVDGRSVSYNNVLGSKTKYYFVYGLETYYFSFN